jgi:hypothetical protein
MRWFRSLDEIGIVCQPNRPLQLLSFAADWAMLSQEIPVSPRMVVPSEGPPVSVYQWYCQNETRSLMLEIEERHRSDEREAVVIYTPFADALDTRGDWTVVVELGDLPRSVFITRPLYIQSRAPKADAGVYRPHPSGWNDSVYVASSYTEAADLLSYLRQDEWNDQCFVGPPEPAGPWEIVRRVVEKEERVGVYPGLGSALKVACQMSLNVDRASLAVRQLSRTAGARKYCVESGRVLPAGGEQDAELLGAGAS